MEQQYITVFYFLFLLFGVIRPIMNIIYPMKIMEVDEMIDPDDFDFMGSIINLNIFDMRVLMFLTDFITMILLIVGIFTSQWFLFIIIFIYNNIESTTPTMIRITSLLQLSLVVLIILNKYYLHFSPF